MAVANVLAYLRRFDAEFAKLAEEELSPLDARSKALVYTNQPREAKEKMTADLDAMVRRFEEKKNDYVQRSSEQEWVRIRQNLQIVGQAHENLVKRGTDPALRDRAMAENVKWLLDQEPPGTKMMLWAHNGHVMKSGYAGAASMGMQLHKILENDMVVFGFAFNQGSFQAVEEGKALRPFTLQGAPKGSLDATLAETGIPEPARQIRLGAWRARRKKIPAATT